MEDEKNRNSQRRRPRKCPPKAFREQLFHSLPNYAGPCSVGIVEIEVPVREPRTFSRIKRNHMHALRMDTVLFLIYYPCDPSSYAQSKGENPSKATWLPRPRALASKGYAKFFGVLRLPVTAYIAATAMFTKLPACRNAKLAGDRAGECAGAAPRSSPGTYSQDTLTKSGDKPRFLVIFFSYGLGGFRTCYSTTGGELASSGFVVIAVEYRDGSGARSYVNIPSNGRLVDVNYILPLDNAQDISTHDVRDVDTEHRHAQIKMRMSKSEEAYCALQLPSDGQGDFSKGLEGINWSDWDSRLLLRNVATMGHSLGGATTVEIVRILLDVWGLCDIGEEVKQGGATCWMLTIKESTHLSQTDFAILYPHWMFFFMKTKVNPKRTVSLTFVAGNTWIEEGILQTKVLITDEPPRAHRPNGKWVASRLGILNELWIRTTNWFRRRARVSAVATDIKGRPLAGLVSFPLGSEVWMHLSPDEEKRQYPIRLSRSVT
ncbi:platelet-activating factor acetylhydrolase, isoform II-domain-containing protein [Daldinia sp. FL1419]|nr:platelet-activating factor acetylhydrolase, isoform II-domain-containing protein [Daldinia sp. FL1419]